MLMRYLLYLSLFSSFAFAEEPGPVDEEEIIEVIPWEEVPLNQKIAGISAAAGVSSGIFSILSWQLHMSLIENNSRDIYHITVPDTQGPHRSEHFVRSMREHLSSARDGDMIRMQYRPLNPAEREITAARLRDLAEAAEEMADQYGNTARNQWVLNSESFEARSHAYRELARGFREQVWWVENALPLSDVDVRLPVDFYSQEEAIRFIEQETAKGNRFTKITLTPRKILEKSDMAFRGIRSGAVGLLIGTLFYFEEMAAGLVAHHISQMSNEEDIPFQEYQDDP